MNPIRNLSRSIRRLALGLAISCATALQPVAQAQDTSTQIQSAITNTALPLRLTNGTYTAAGTTNPVFTLYQDKQLGMYAHLVTTNASTSNQTFTVEFSPDGTNWLTSPTADFVVPLNGTTSSKYHTNFPAILTANFRKVRLKSELSTAIASFWVTNLWFERH